MNEQENNLKLELEKLRAENQALKGMNQKQDLSFRVSEKGAVSIYGLGRFPVTLYKDQWLRLLQRASDIEKFIQDHEAQLKTKT